MGSCDGFQVEGYLRVASSGKRQIFLELKPTSNLWKELCSFCDENPVTPPSAHSHSDKHSHNIEGVFSMKNNKLLFTLNDSTITTVNEVNENIDSRNDLAYIQEKVSDTVSQPLPKLNGALQYQVDGKIYEIRASVSNEKSHNPAQVNCPGSLAPSLPLSKPTATSKSIEFIIDNKKYSTTNLTQETLDIFSEASSKRTSDFEATLKILQVRLKDNGVIPDQIICGPDTSTFLQNMRELAKLIAPNGQNVFKCEQCHEEMTSYFPYIEHMFKHFGSRPYICTVCQASFQTRAVMRHHLDMHGGKAPFECEFCGKKFRNSCHMKQHRMRHTGERPHNCPYCEKSFAHKNVLKIHLQVHTGEKPCCCDLCGKLFRERHRLACHLATHYKSEKSLECTNCGKSFKTIGMLKLHEAKRCSSKSVQNTDVAIEDSSLDGLQNVPYDESLNDTNLMNAEHEVTIIEAETLEVLPVNTYIVEPSSVGAMLVQFSIDQDDTQEIAPLQDS